MNKFDLILLDLDGVLADFHSAALKHFGHDPQTFAYNLGSWEIHESLGLTEDEFWEKIDAIPDFWETIEPTPWMNDLIAAAREHAKEWAICSSPSRSPNSSAGKIRWMYKHIKPRFRDYVLTKHKYYLAKPNVVLIDDADHNINAFDKAGGFGLLVPQPWNSGWRLKMDMQFVVKTLRYFGTLHGV